MDQSEKSTQPRNAPQQRPPRDVQLPPTEYMPMSGRPLVTAVETTRDVNMPNDPERPRASTFHIEVKRVMPQPLVPEGPAPVLHQGFPRSVFAEAQGPISETCKFTPAEQQRLLEFRRKLVRCERELSTLCDLVSVDGAAAATGLPKLREAHRSRLDGKTYSSEEASRDLNNVWLLDRLRSYTAFIDHALADRLDPEPGPSQSLWSVRSMEVRTPQPRTPPPERVPFPSGTSDYILAGTSSSGRTLPRPLMSTSPMSTPRAVPNAAASKLRALGAAVMTPSLKVAYEGGTVGRTPSFRPLGAY